MININRTKQIIETEDEGPTLDYKEDLLLETDGDKAKFVKDVVSLANSGQTAHIIIGIQDGTRKLMGIKTSHSAEKLNEILKDKCDPPLHLGYAERKIMGHTIGVIEIAGDNPPYIVAVRDRYGGHLSSDAQKPFHIERGTVFVRNYNMNDGAKRADLDKMYKVKYATLETDVQVSHKLSMKPSGDSIEADISFLLTNVGDVLATQPYVWVQFKDVKELVRCTGKWVDISKLNDNILTIRYLGEVPLYPKLMFISNGAVIKVAKDTKQIEAYMRMGAGNIRVKEGAYIIPLGE